MRYAAVFDNKIHAVRDTVREAFADMPVSAGLCTIRYYPDPGDKILLVHPDGHPELWRSSDGMLWDSNGLRRGGGAMTEITREEYMDPNNGWMQYRSVRSREAAIWYIERLDESRRQYAIVNRGSYYTIAERYNNQPIWQG